jgi:hypothetical protein
MATPSPTSRPRGSAESQRNVRHTYLIGRLRNRQITMEEATELFGIMQEMLRQSEAARLAAVGTPGLAPAIPGAPVRPAPATRAAPPSGSDDLFLVGLLAMGAGAGLLAAMTKRIAEGAVPASSQDRSRDASDGSKR